jgi:hypothetical protein
VGASFFDFLETEPFVEVQGRVVRFHVDADRLTLSRRFGHDVPHDLAADAEAPVLRRQGDVDDPMLIVRAIKVKPTDRK